MKDSTAFEQQIRRIYELIAESGAEVTWNDHIGDPDNPPRMRQIDVTLRRNGSLTLIECRQHKAAQDVQWIECLIGRRISLGAQSVIAVSSSGFTSGALVKARQYAIVPRDLKRLTDQEVMRWGQRIELTLHYYQYSDLEVSLLFPPESLATINPEALKSELRWHPCIQSLFNAASQKLTEGNLMAGELQGRKVRFGVQIEFDNLQLCAAPLLGAGITGSAELGAIKADAPIVYAYGEPNESSGQREAIVQDFQSMRHTSIATRGDRISLFLDVSQVEIPSCGQFRFVEVSSEREVDHDVFEVFGIEEKLKVNCTGLKVLAGSRA